MFIARVALFRPVDTSKSCILHEEESMRRGPLRHAFLAIGEICGACIRIHIHVCVREECKKRTHRIQLYVINQYVLKNYGHKKQVVFCLSGLAAWPRQ